MKTTMMPITKKYMRQGLLGLYLCLFLTAGVMAAEKESTKLSLPWEDLRRLLNLDQNQIRLRWSEFQVLLQHTGQKKLPPFSISHGDVLLAKEEFGRLIQSLILPPAPLSSTHITKASYYGKVKKSSVQIKAELNLHIQHSGGRPKEIDVFPGHFAFQEILLNGEPALTEQKNGRLYITTKKEGHQTLQIQFSVPLPKDKRVEAFSFSVIPTPITKVEFDIPEENIDVKISNALQVEKRPYGEGTHVSAILSPTSWIQASWFPVIPNKNKGPAKIYADINHLLSIEDDALRVRTTIQSQILNNTINSMIIDLPEGYAVIQVEGDVIGEWHQTEEASQLKIPFKYARGGSFSMGIVLEKILPEKKTNFSFSGFRIRDAVREKGFLGLELKTSAEVTEPTFQKLDRVDLKELPVSLVTQSERPLLYAYRYLRHPYQIEFGVERHEDVMVLSSMIDEVNGTSWLLEEGKRVHHITYQLRNSWKQFLEVTLPGKMEVWSVFVEGQPVKPSKKGDHVILIPLNRSKAEGGILKPFQVELVCYEEGSKLWVFGRNKFVLPITDLMANRVTWGTYLPYAQRFFYLGRDLKKEYIGVATPQTIDVSSRIGREKQNLFREGELSRNEPASPKEPLLYEAEMVDAMGKSFLLDQKKRDKDLGIVGVLPIRVQLPFQGQFVSFSKTLADKGIPIKLTLYHVSDGLIQLVKLFLIVMILTGLYRFRNALIQILQSTFKRIPIPSFFPIRKAVPFHIFLVSIVFCLVLSYLSPYQWLSIAWLFFLGALAYWIHHLIRVPKEGEFL